MKRIGEAAAGRRRLGSGRLAPVLLVVLSASVLAGAATTATKPPKPVKHLVGARVVGGSGELFERRTGRRFVARGANYIRLGPEGHATFTVGRYDGRRAGAALQRMRALGYNAVRVFLGGDCAGCPGAPGGGISRAYARNVADFLRRAKRAGQLVILTTQWLPASYAGLIGDSPLVDDVNRIYLTDGGIRAYGTFWRDLVVELRRQAAPLEVVLAYDIVNEGAFVVNQPPFTLSTGTLVAPGGARYDLADPAAKERLLGDGLVVFGNRVRALIRKVDPTALVSASFFVPTAPNPTRPGDVRDLRTRPVIERSQLDLVDVHAYPGFDLTLARTLQNFGLDGPTRKPVLIGEMGAFHDPYATAAEAAVALQAWQAASCRYGVDGWLLWTWDTDEQPELWNGRSGGDVIATALARTKRPDPCKAPPGSTNLALGKPATASAAAGGPAANAFDGNVASAWLSEADPPQWIEVDLGQATTVAAVRLVAAQYPAEGATAHRVWTRGGGAGDGYVLRETLSGTTRDGQRLEARSGAPWTNVRYLRVETIQSLSWVAWKEIEVLAP
jgi:hypothetical protein